MWGTLGYEKALYLDELTDGAIAVITEHVPKKSSPLSFCPTFIMTGAYRTPRDGDTAFGGSRTAGYVFNIEGAASTQAGYEAERTWAWEPWSGTYEWREASVTRPSGTQHRWALDQLVAVRDEERLRVGCITRVAQDVHGEIALSLRLWSATPKAIVVRPLSTIVTEDPPLPTLLLGETPEDKPSLILPPRTFNPSRVLRSLDSGPERRFRLTRLIHRGADFERVAFEETL